MAENPEVSARNRHFAMRMWWLRDMVEKSQLTFTYIPTVDQLADIYIHQNFAETKVPAPSYVISSCLQNFSPRVSNPAYSCFGLGGVKLPTTQASHRTNTGLICNRYLNYRRLSGQHCTFTPWVRRPLLVATYPLQVPGGILKMTRPLACHVLLDRMLPRYFCMLPQY